MEIVAVNQRDGLVDKHEVAVCDFIAAGFCRHLSHQQVVVLNLELIEVLVAETADHVEDLDYQGQELFLVEQLS